MTYTCYKTLSLQTCYKTLRQRQIDIDVSFGHYDSEMYPCIMTKNNVVSTSIYQPIYQPIDDVKILGCSDVEAKSKIM